MTCKLRSFSSGFTNTEKWLKRAAQPSSVSIGFEVFGCLMKHSSFQVFDIVCISCVVFGVSFIL